MLVVIDTSAVVAIALNEPDSAELELQIADDPVRLISAATLLEATIVLETRLGDAGGRQLDLGCSRSEPKLSRWMRNRPTRRGVPGDAMAKGAMLLG